MSERGEREREREREREIEGEEKKNQWFRFFFLTFTWRVCKER